MIDPSDQQAMYEYYNKRPTVGDAWGPPGLAGGMEPGPERDRLAAAEQAQFAADLMATVRDRHVLELACGNGSSTVIAAETAKTILATELAPEPLQLAVARGLPVEKVRFESCNAFDLLDIPGDFDAVVATGFIDHVPRERLDAFLSDLEERAAPGGRIFLSGSQWTQRAKGLRVERAGCADTYMRRPLNDGSEYLILDNEFTEAELLGIFMPRGEDVKINYGRFRWWVRYAVKQGR